MASDRSLVVVRGSTRAIDPTTACMANSADVRSRYLLLEMDADGSVVDRQTLPASQRAEVERRMSDASYRGVHVDMRTDPSLLKLTPPARAVAADLASYRRAKSDEEMEALVALSKRTHDMLEGNFRGAAQRDGQRSAFHVTRAKGFTQYRGGLQDAKGRCSDVTRVEPKNAEWEARLERAYRGLDAVDKYLKAGVHRDTLNKLFMAHVNPEDVVYGDVVWHIGFESHEQLPCETLQPFDVVNTGVAIGNGFETAVVYRGARAIPMPALARPAEYRSGTATARSSESGDRDDDDVEALGSPAAEPSAGGAPAAALPAAALPAGETPAEGTSKLPTGGTPAEESPGMATSEPAGGLPAPPAAEPMDKPLMKPDKRPASILRQKLEAALDADPVYVRTLHPYSQFADLPTKGELQFVPRDEMHTRFWAFPDKGQMPEVLGFSVFNGDFVPGSNAFFVDEKDIVFYSAPSREEVVNHLKTRLKADGLTYSSAYEEAYAEVSPVIEAFRSGDDMPEDAPELVQTFFNTVRDPTFIQKNVESICFFAEVDLIMVYHIAKQLDIQHVLANRLLITSLSAYAQNVGLDAQKQDACEQYRVLAALFAMMRLNPDPKHMQRAISRVKKNPAIGYKIIEAMNDDVELTREFAKIAERRKKK